ncbi:MAG: hypothetical protein AMJ88_18830 [Anaerolineae bacterium SM23_ 63]|nr:MAG: hypothetical protein AMJ88_18830 [Anaerolineae bacterium SM23_ 63]
MVSDDKTADRITKWIRWLARGTGSFFAFSFVYLGLTTSPTPPSLQEVAVVLSLVLGVLIAWWREELGGLILIFLAAVLFLIMGFFVAVESPDQRSTLLLVFVVPYLLPGSLFLLSWWRSRKSGTILSSA